MSDIVVTPIGASDHRLHRQFIEFPKRLYQGNDNWVPMFDLDALKMLRKKHVYFQTYPARFLIARRGEETVGQMLVSYNRNYIKQHKRNCAHFSFFDTVEDPEVATALFDAAARWGRRYGANELIGPIFAGYTSGSGMLVQGFDRHASMTMMAYNYPYYPQFMTDMGFSKFSGLCSFEMTNMQTYKFPERLNRFAQAVMKRGRFSMMRFPSKRKFKNFAAASLDICNSLLADHLENYPATPAELRMLLKDVDPLLNHKIIKVLRYQDEIAGFLLIFPDISRAMQRSKGKVSIPTIIDMIKERNGTDKFVVNGIGILPQYQRLGGSALLYYDLFNTFYEHWDHLQLLERFEFTQIADTTTLIVDEMDWMGARLCKLHYIYCKDIG